MPVPSRRLSSADLRQDDVAQNGESIVGVSKERAVPTATLLLERTVDARAHAIRVETASGCAIGSAVTKRDIRAGRIVVLEHVRGKTREFQASPIGLPAPDSPAFKDAIRRLVRLHRSP
jgi:hypothetical protein